MIIMPEVWSGFEAVWEKWEQLHVPGHTHFSPINSYSCGGCANAKLWVSQTHPMIHMWAVGLRLLALY